LRDGPALELHPHQAVTQEAVPDSRCAVFFLLQEQTMIRSKYLMMVILVWMGLALLPAAMAQSDVGEPASPAPSFNEDELRSFALVVLEVQRINDVYVAKFGAAQSHDEQEQVRQEATGEVAKVAEQNGMSLGRFQEILNHTRVDEGLAERVREHIRENK